MRKLSCLLITLFLTFNANSQNNSSEYFEMRTYHAHEGKRTDLIKRFEDHTLRLFEKNGISRSFGFFPASIIKIR